MIDSYLARWVARIGMDPKRLDEAGFAEVRRGSATVGLTVLEDHGVLLLVAPVMPVPKARREELYRKLLELSFVSTADAAFAIDSEKDEIYVRALRRLSALDYEEFEDLLETVGRVANEWDDVLQRSFGP